MASTPIEFRINAGLTLTADLVAADDTVRQSALSATQLTNGKGRYRVAYTGSATGHHTLHVKSGTDVILVDDYDLKDTTDVQYPLRISRLIDAVTQPGQETPAANQTAWQMLAFLYKAWRNKSDQDASTYQLYNDDAATVDQKATVAVASGTVTRGEIASGP